MCWYSSGDVSSLLSESIRRNRFDEILKNLHLANNEALNPLGRIAKLRPFVSQLQQKFRENNYLDEHLCIDESMIPYYGRHFEKAVHQRKAYSVWIQELGHLLIYRVRV